MVVSICKVWCVSCTLHPFAHTFGSLFLSFSVSLPLSFCSFSLYLSISPSLCTAPIHTLDSTVRDPLRIGKDALALTNNFRAQNRLFPLKWHQSLYEIGLKHSQGTTRHTPHTQHKYTQTHTRTHTPM